MKRYLVATRNANKVREIRAIGALPVELVPLPPDLPGVVEDGDSFLANARKKARQYHRATGLPTIAEDSGLEVEALGGAPGVHSARFAGPDADAEANNRLLLQRLEGVPEAERTARFVCVMVCIDESGEAVFEGEVRGRIALAPAGRGGFGYDPLFIPEGHDRSFAELPPEVKNGMSHRYHALMKLARHLRTRAG